jgi:hypothetical protein
MLCSGCSSRTPTQTRLLRLEPPGALLLQIPEPVLSGIRNKDLLQYALRLRSALREANADKSALEAWANHQKEE